MKAFSHIFCGSLCGQIEFIDTTRIVCVIQSTTEEMKQGFYGTQNFQMRLKSRVLWISLPFEGDMYQ